MQAGFNGAHFYTVNRAGFNAKIAAGTFTGDDGVHVFSRAQNGVDGAGLNTFGAADAFVFANIGHRGHGLFYRVEGFGFYTQ